MTWKRSWPDLRYCSGSCLEELNKTTNTFSQGIRSPDREMNSGCPKYEAGVLATRPLNSLIVGGKECVW
jgi:hypothetical protein